MKISSKNRRKGPIKSEPVFFQNFEQKISVGADRVNQFQGVDAKFPRFWEIYENVALVPKILIILK